LKVKRRSKDYNLRALRYVRIPLEDPVEILCQLP